MELILPYINPLSLSSGLVNKYEFDLREAWNAHHFRVPQVLGTGSVQMFIRSDFHYFRGKWKFNQPTQFLSLDPVGQGIIDFRINNNGGDILSASVYGEKKFEWDITEVDGFRFFVPEKYFDLSKSELISRFEKYRRNPNIYEVEKQLFKIDVSELSNVMMLESKMLELLFLWVDILKNNQIDSHFEEVSDHNRRCLENARLILAGNIQDTPSIKMLSRAVGLNENYLKRDFRKLYGLPVKQYIIQTRMESARKLIRETDLPVQEISSRLGYANRGHFADLYRRFFGVSPLIDRTQNK